MEPRLTKKLNIAQTTQHDSTGQILVKFEWVYLHQGAKYMWGRPYRKNLRLLGTHSRKQYEIVSMKGDCAPSRTVILPMTLNCLNHPKSPLLFTPRAMLALQALY